MMSLRGPPLSLSDSPLEIVDPDSDICYQKEIHVLTNDNILFCYRQSVEKLRIVFNFT